VILIPKNKNQKNNIDYNRILVASLVIVVAAFLLLNILIKSDIYPTTGLAPKGGAAKCANALDDDGDGLKDYPADLGCSSTSDSTETWSPSKDPTKELHQCDNGKDDGDLDTVADYKVTTAGDPGCTSVTDNDEKSQCENSADDDGDGKIDYGTAEGKDSKCSGYSDNVEDPKDSCSDTDGGNAKATGGTASGYDESVAFSYTDYCVSTTLLKEYYCGSKAQDYAPLTADITCAASETCSNGACVASVPTADITVLNTVGGQTTKVGVTEGSAFYINDLTNLGAKYYRIYYGTDRYMNSNNNYEDFITPYGSPTIADIKEKLVNWPTQKAALEGLINFNMVNQRNTGDLWGQGASLYQQLTQLKANGVTPILTFRNNNGGSPTGAPPANGFPFTENDWNEYWYYVFGVVYWANVYNNFGVEMSEVYNEPQFYFGGTPAQYSQLVDYTEDAIKTANDLAGVNTRLMAAVDVADTGGNNYLTRALDDEATYSYTIDYADYHNYGRFKSDITAAHEISDILSGSGKNMPMIVSEMGVYTDDTGQKLPHPYTSNDEGEEMAKSFLGLSQIQKDKPNRVEAGILFVVRGPWGVHDGLINNGIETPTYKAIKNYGRCGNGRILYQTSPDDRNFIVAKEGTAIYIYSVNTGVSTLTKAFDLSALGKTSGTFDKYDYSSANQDVLVMDNGQYNNGIVSVSAPPNGATCVIIT